MKIIYSEPSSKADIARQLGLKMVTGHLNRVIRELLAQQQIGYTIPEKPNSRLQQYRITAEGKKRIKDLRN